MPAGEEEAGHSLFLPSGHQLTLFDSNGAWEWNHATRSWETAFELGQALSIFPHSCLNLPLDVH
jgi:hypothetical protein